MHITNKEWRIDEDGFLRITCCILQTAVLDYAKSETGGLIDIDGDTVHEFVDVNNISEEVLKTLEGKPVIVGEHVWQDIDHNEPVGSIAGTPTINDSNLMVDVLITNPDVIAKIQSGELIEISAGYDANIVVASGVYNNSEYDIIQEPTNFNHILLLPEGCGRCGSEVRIVNTKNINETSDINNINNTNEVQSMKIIKVQNKEYRFQNEDDSKVAEEMVEDTKALNAEELQNACDELTEVKNQLDELTSKKDELEKLLAEYKAKIEELMSPEHASELAEEAVQQNADEDAVLENSDVEDKEGIKEQCKNAKTFAERRQIIVSNCMANKYNTSWSQDAVDGAFEALVMNSKQVKKVMNSAESKAKEININNNLERMLRPLSK